MNDTNSSPADKEALDVEGARWFARMRAEDAEVDRGAFETWLATSAAHRAAYNRAAEIFSMGKVLTDGPVPNTAPEPSRRRPALGFAAVTACAAVAIAGGWTLLHERQTPDASTANSAPPGDERRTLFTTGGETRLVRLADGSSVELARGTRLEVAFDATRRGIRLDMGQARFTVAHGSRPFTVFAGGGSVTARGTVFDVALRGSKSVDVRLIQGVIDVVPARTGTRTQPSTVRRLVAGERISFDAGAGDRSDPLAMKDGAPQSSSASVPEFDGITVAQLVARANAGAPRPIRLSDPTLGAARVSGRFRVDDTRLLAERLAALLDARADFTDPQAVHLRR